MSFAWSFTNESIYLLWQHKIPRYDTSTSAICTAMPNQILRKSHDATQIKEAVTIIVERNGSTVFHSIYMIMHSWGLQRSIAMHPSTRLAQPLESTNLVSIFPSNSNKCFCYTPTYPRSSHVVYLAAFSFLLYTKNRPRLRIASSALDLSSPNLRLSIDFTIFLTLGWTSSRCL